MKEVELSVSIISHTKNPLETIYLAARQCYSAGSVADMVEKDSREKMAELVQKCIRSGHTSVLEHVSFTFAISGVSRALSHQLVRHRMASYSQQSQRYVKAGELEYVCPEIFSSEEFDSEGMIFLDAIKYAEKAYKEMLASGVLAEDARFVLPNATATNIVMSMNCRELLHFIENRCCLRAQWEIQKLALNVRRELADELPEVFSNVWAKCRRIGYCPEEKSCGWYPKKGE